MWTEDQVRSHPNTAAAEIKCLRTMLKNMSQAVIDWDDTDTESQSRRAQERMLSIASSIQSLIKE